MESFPEMTNKVTALVRSDRDRRSWSDEWWCWRGTSDPEVPERARRRMFTAKYKLEILAAYERRPRW